MQDKKKRIHHHDTQHTAQHTTTSKHKTPNSQHTQHNTRTTHDTTPHIHTHHTYHTPHIARTHHHHNTHIAHTTHTRMLGHVHGGQPTVILRRKSECLEMCSAVNRPCCCIREKICNICHVCNFMRTLLFLELISYAKYFCIFLTEMVLESINDLHL